jgi:AraC family transcriptional regulator of adaptative response/methylated-DNA-[protein]-cysteine methyltransferase
MQATDPPAPYSTPDERWQAVVERDTGADGYFIIGVHSTGIYCRPGCPAKTPLRENVRFYASIVEATRAGLRPCKRCKPQAESLAERQVALVAEACARIESAEEPPSLADLASDAGMSPFHFHRIFKSVTSLTPGQYRKAHRSQRMRAELASARNVTRAMYDAGFQSSGAFYAASRESLGMPPSTFRNKGDGEQIQVVVRPTSIGHILIAMTNRGICGITIGDDPDRLLAEFSARFANAEISPACANVEDIVTAVIASVEQPSVPFDLPLDLRGTAFQHRVWNALRAIPPGTTTTYSDLARKIDAPASSRAVANACGANPAAVLVPCHRVVRKDGHPGGYRWGVERKLELLEREQQGVRGDRLREPEMTV